MTAKTLIMSVQGVDISITNVNEQDYICLTDMLKAKDGDFFITDWLRNKNTLEYIGAWEEINNPYFNYGEFAIIKNNSGTNSYKISSKEWKEKTNAIGIIAKTGRYGGTYAHKDIAFHFGMWISPLFQLYIVKEYQRLKEVESNQYNLEWNVKRMLSKTNYSLHTDAIKTHIIPTLSMSQKRDWVYTDEVDMLNLVMFGCTAKQWREANQQRVLNGENIRDMASINELIVLSNLESLNSMLIQKNMSNRDRRKLLSEVAQTQRKVLDKIDFVKSLKKQTETSYVEASKPQLTDFDKKMKITGKK